jgi:hypothetical protein
MIKTSTRAEKRRAMKNKEREGGFTPVYRASSRWKMPTKSMRKELAKEAALSKENNPNNPLQRTATLQERGAAFVMYLLSRAEARTQRLSEV